jgi:hypothetical protein
MSEKTLKQTMAPHLFALYLLALSLILVSEFGFPAGTAGFDFVGRLVVFAPAVALGGLLANLLPANIKSAIVFTRLRNILPAHRVLELVEKDERIAPDSFAYKWPEISTARAKDRNSLWYSKIYRPVQDEPQVVGAHQNYLMYRDACGGVLVVLIAMIVWQLFGPVAETSPPGIFATYVLSAYTFLLLIAARNNGNRMVVNAVLCAGA